MRVLVSGASGFLGSALCCRLSGAGHEVVAMLRSRSSRRRLEGFEGRTEVCDDTRVALSLVQEFEPDAVLHTACSYGRQDESLLQLVEANIFLGMALLQGILAGGENSGKVLFLNTGTALPREVSRYALSKHQFAEWGRRAATDTPQRLQFVNIELQHMYGPGDDLSKFTTHVMHACRRHVPSLALTAGEQRRDFIYLDDVLSGYLFLLDHAAALPKTADVPLGSGAAPSVREYVELVHALCASRTELRFGALPYRSGEAMHCVADLELMAKLGWAPAWSLREGLRRTLELETFE